MRDLAIGAQALFLVVIVAAAGVIILDAFQDDQETTIAVIDDTINCTTLGTAATLDANAALPFWVEALDNTFRNVTNSTDTVIRAGNFTVNTAAGTLTCTSGGLLAAHRLYNVSYRYVTGSDARNVFGDGITGVGELTSWLEIIALIIAASIILYLVFKGMDKQPGAGRY